MHLFTFCQFKPMKIPFRLPGAIVTENEADHAGRCLYAIHPVCNDPGPQLADKGGMDQRAVGMKT